ncbi:WapI family immunity protein [Kineococcus sp. SYSU DK002]|uniref:WapI family immunity protein n=1 Tax=Kineococcus sp. SYSU DK002 TaxID=3383123 RepID=UPI003D7DBB4E
MQLTSTDGAVFELRPSGYEYPDFTSAGEPDANWLIVHGRVRTAAGESWTFEGPDLSTWEAQELLDWLHAAAEGRLEPSDDPGSDVVTSTLMFIEPNLAFSIAAVEGEQTVLRVHLSLEAVAGKPGWTTDSRPRIYGYCIPLRVDRVQLLTAAQQWNSDIAPFPAR